MNIQAFTRAISDSGGGMKEVQSLFACQREAAERDRARFGLQERLDSLTRLKNAIKRREGDIIRAIDADFRKPEHEVRLTELFPGYQEISHAQIGRASGRESVVQAV